MMVGMAVWLGVIETFLVVSPLVAGFPFALVGLIIGVEPGCSLIFPVFV